MKNTKKLQKEIDFALEENKTVAGERKDKERAKNEDLAETENNNTKEADSYVNSVSLQNKDKEIFNENGYAVYYEDGEAFDADTDEIVLHNHEMYSDYNVDTVLGWIDELYEPGMNKNDLKEVLYSNVEASEDEINKAIDIYWDGKL